MSSDLKKFLKNLKLNENNISMVLGALVVVIVGILIFNYFKDRKNADLGNLTLESAQTASEHVVVEGETLWSIAETRYGSGYNWVDVAKENNIKGDAIEVGQKLSLPNVSAKKPTATKLSSALEPDSAISAKTYTVAKGDSLWNIAVRAYGDGYKWVEIAEANSLKNPNLIHSGNVLVLP